MTDAASQGFTVCSRCGAGFDGATGQAAVDRAKTAAAVADAIAAWTELRAGTLTNSGALRLASRWAALELDAEEHGWYGYPGSEVAVPLPQQVPVAAKVNQYIRWLIAVAPTLVRRDPGDEEAFRFRLASLGAASDPAILEPVATRRMVSRRRLLNAYADNLVAGRTADEAITMTQSGLVPRPDREWWAGLPADISTYALERLLAEHDNTAEFAAPIAQWAFWRTSTMGPQDAVLSSWSGVVVFKPVLDAMIRLCSHWVVRSSLVKMASQDYGRTWLPGEPPFKPFDTYKLNPRHQGRDLAVFDLVGIGTSESVVAEGIRAIFRRTYPSIEVEINGPRITPIG